MDELIRRAQSGDEHAFEELINSSYDRMFKYAMKWSGNRANAEDITHQACLKLTRGLHQFRFESAFDTWLYRLVVNCAKDWHKAHKRYTHFDVDSDTEATAPESDAEGGVHLHQILNQIDQLGDGYRETVLLVFGEGFSHRETGEILNISESTVSWRIHEIRKRLTPLREGDSHE